MSQVLVNLCVNACDAMTSAGSRRELQGEPIYYESITRWGHGVANLNLKEDRLWPLMRKLAFNLF